MALVSAHMETKRYAFVEERKYRHYEDVFSKILILQILLVLLTLWWKNLSHVISEKCINGPFSRPRGGGGGGGCAMISEAADRSEEAASSSSLRAASHAAVASSIVDAADVISLFSVRHIRCGASSIQGRTPSVMRSPSSSFEFA